MPLYVHQKRDWYDPQTFSATTLGAAVDCAPAINAALVAAKADGVKGVELRRMTYGVAATAESPSDAAYDVAILAQQLDVKFRGSGKGSVLKRISNEKYHVVEVYRSDGGGIEQMAIDGNATALTTGAGSAGFNLTSGTAGEVTGFEARSLWVTDTLGYGVGLQFGNYDDILLDLIDIDGTDWDGIDVKYRYASPGPFVNQGIHLGRSWARNFGRSNADNAQTGFDLRGPVTFDALLATDFGASARAGVRFRGGATSDTNFGSNKSSGGFIRVVKGASGAAANTGVELNASNCNLSNAVVEDCQHGYWVFPVGGDTLTQGVTINGTQALNCDYGYRFGADTQGVVAQGLLAKGCDWGVYDEGDNNTIDGFVGIDNAQNHIRTLATCSGGKIGSTQYIGSTPAGTGGNLRNDGGHTIATYA